jgi:hypothetical protein
MEIWKDVVGYEGLYQVSNLGNIKSNKCGREKILKQSKNSAGYFSITLYKDKKRDTKFTHILVAMAFLNHTPNRYKIVVDHVDNDRTNNNLLNIRLVTQAENTKNKIGKTKGHYTSMHSNVFFNKINKRWVSTFVENKTTHYVGTFKTEHEAVNALKKYKEFLLTN